MFKFISTILICYLFVSCSIPDRSEGILPDAEQPKEIYRVNGKDYHFVYVRPAINKAPVPLFIPLDTTMDAPVMINYRTGKSSNNAIILK